MYWLRLIRWNNLLIILLTQLLAWWCVIWPLNGIPIEIYTIGKAADIRNALPLHLHLSPLNFSLLCLSTILIAAAGYIINDYFDIRIDAINKPDRVILEKQIPRRLAIIMHSVMNGIALLLAGIVAWQAHHPELILVQGCCTFLLWKYSTTWKRQFMIGNIVVSFMTGLTVIVLLLYETSLYPYFTKPVSLAIFFELYFVSFFAFILTWMREIVKDMEDYKGDADEGCVTMPIKWGLKKSILFIRVLGMLSLFAIVLAVPVAYIRGRLSVLYLFGLFLAILAWLIFIGIGATKAHYHKASTYLKLIMVMGIGTLIIYRYFS